LSAVKKHARCVWFPDGSARAGLHFQRGYVRFQMRCYSAHQWQTHTVLHGQHTGGVSGAVEHAAGPGVQGKAAHQLGPGWRNLSCSAYRCDDNDTKQGSSVKHQQRSARPRTPVPALVDGDGTPLHCAGQAVHALQQRPCACPCRAGALCWGRRCLREPPLAASLQFKRDLVEVPW
jgi:hypothetical protein